MMEKKIRVVINVYGHVGVGKTTVAELLTELLEAKGFRVELKDSPGDQNIPAEAKAKRLEFLPQNVEIEVVTRQLQRGVKL